MRNAGRGSELQSVNQLLCANLRHPTVTMVYKVAGYDQFLENKLLEGFIWDWFSTQLGLFLSLFLTFNGLLQKLSGRKEQY